MPLDSVMQMLCMVNYILNGERLGLDGISIRRPTTRVAGKHWLLSVWKTISRQRMSSPCSGTAQYLLHRADHPGYYQFGRHRGIKKWISSAPAVRPGVMASDQLRQIKNTFIVTATLVSRAAIRGMEAEDALALSDAYIQKCELLSDVGRINNLQYNMVMEYTELVEQIRKTHTTRNLLLRLLIIYVVICLSQSQPNLLHGI